MRIASLVFVALAACSSVAPGPYHPDASESQEAAPPAPDTTIGVADDLAQAVDLPVSVDLAIPDAAGQLDIVAGGLDLVARAEVRSDLPSRPEAGPEVGPEVGPIDTKLSFSACAYLGERVSVMKAGTSCGRYPQLGPNGTILCYIGCTVERLLNSTSAPPATAKADASPSGYCSANVDNYATSGSTDARLGLCFTDATTCASVCLGS